MSWFCCDLLWKKSAKQTCPVEWFFFLSHVFPNSIMVLYNKDEWSVPFLALDHIRLVSHVRFLIQMILWVTTNIDVLLLSPAPQTWSDVFETCIDTYWYVSTPQTFSLYSVKRTFPLAEKTCPMTFMRDNRPQSRHSPVTSVRPLPIAFLLPLSNAALAMFAPNDYSYCTECTCKVHMQEHTVSSHECSILSDLVALMPEAGRRCTGRQNSTRPKWWTRCWSLAPPCRWRVTAAAAPERSKMQQDAASIAVRGWILGCHGGRRCDMIWYIDPSDFILWEYRWRTLRKTRKNFLQPRYWIAQFIRICHPLCLSASYLRWLVYRSRQHNLRSQRVWVLFYYRIVSELHQSARGLQSLYTH